MTHSIYCYPWTLEASSLPQRLSELRALGVSEVSLAASYHAGKFIHPSAKSQRVVFPEDGCVYFQPRLEYGTLQPKVSRTTLDEDILQTLCDSKEISVNAWTVLFHNTRLGLEHPEATVRNAFGDSYPYSLCPVNPAVRDYGRTLCRDIAQHYPVKQLLVETPGFLSYAHGYHHEFAQVEPNPWLDAWLGLCFCQYCVSGASRAGIDAELLKHRARHLVDGFLASRSQPSTDMAQSWLLADLVQEPELTAFLRWRCEQVTTLVEEINQDLNRTTRLRIIATTQRPHATSFWEGTDLHALSQAAEGLELPLYQPSTPEVISDAEDVIRRVGGAERLSAIVRPGWPDMHSEGQLRETLSQLSALGIQDVAFYNYDMLRPENLCWLKNTLNV